MQPQRLTITRLQKQEIALEKQPLKGVIVARDGLLKFHFCLYDLDGPYKGGYYHGMLQLHENYPFNAPKLIFYTPSGRFEQNIPICTSFTSYHQETWTSAWNVRTLILATISFMYSQEAGFGCRSDSFRTRETFAKKSLSFNLQNKQFVRLFKDKLVSEGLLPQQQQKLEELESPLLNQQPQNQGYRLKKRIICSIGVIIIVGAAFYLGYNLK